MTSHPLYTPRNALVGSVARRKVTNWLKAGESWQEQLWNIYTHLGPVHYGISFKRNSASRVAYFPAEDLGEGEPEETDNPRVVEAYERLGDVQELVAEIVAHLNVAGETYLVGQEREEETWEVWSTAEVNAARQPSSRTDGVEQLEVDDFLLRIWRPSPYRRHEPDSPLRSVQAQCEQLLLLNEQIGATAQSRLSAGIMLIPEELSFASSASEPPDTGGNMDGDPFQAEVIEMITASITDTQSAARVAPGIVRGPSEYLDKVRLIDFARSMDETFASMREELLRQIAAGLDLPPEIILGYGDLNHWTGWAVDESAARLHVDPDILFVINALTEGYLRVVLEEGGMGHDEAERYLIWRDHSDLTARPLSVEQGIELLKLGVISDEFMRDLANIPDDAAGTGVMRETPEAPQESGPENVVQVPPDQAIVATMVASGRRLDRLADLDMGLASKVIEATEAAFGRAMERAGAKIRSNAKKDRQVSAAIQSVDNPDVAMFLGAARTAQFGLTADQLIPADTYDPLARRLTKLLGEAEAKRMLELGFLERPAPVPAEQHQEAVDMLIAVLIALSINRLFTPTPALDPAETGEFSDTLLTGELTYAFLATAGGSAPTVEIMPNGPTVTHDPDIPRGYALGAVTRASLVDNGYLITSDTWRYGYPGNEFPPHRALDGVIVESGESPQLRVSPVYSWLGVSYYFPGDHKGCLCSLVPTIEEA